LKRTQGLNSYWFPALVIAIAFLGSNEGLFAQSIDSLKALLPKKSGTEKVDVLIQLTIASHGSGKFDEAFDYASKANEIAYQLGDSLRIVKTCRIKGQILRRLDKLKESIKSFESALSIAERHKDQKEFSDELKFILNGLALVQTFLANYDKALDFHFRSIAIREREGDKADISTSLNNIGFVYYKLRNYTRAKECFERALLLKEEVKDTFDLDRLLINIGLSNLYLRNFKDALLYINRGLKTCGSLCGEDILVEGKFGLGVAYYGLKDFSRSMNFLQQSFELSKKTDNKRYQSENLVYMALINIAQDNIKQSIIFLREAEQLARVTGYNELLLDAYKHFATAYSRTRDFENASFYQSRYITLNDSLFGSVQVKNIAAAQTAVEERENRTLIDLQKTALDRQRYLNIAIALIVVLGGLLLFGLYRRNILLKQKSEILAEQNREKTGMISIVAHDLKAPLNKIKGLMSLLGMTSKFSTEQQEYVNYIEQSIVQGNHLIRDLLDVHSFEHDDSKVEAEEFDLKLALDDWQHTMNGQLQQKKQSLLTHIDLQDGKKVITDRFKLIRILDNVLTNASKFSASEKDIHFRVWQADHTINFSIKDQGPGISEEDKKKLFKRFQKLSARPTAGESSSGLGLSIIHVLISKLGGSIKVNSKLGEGAEFVITLPIAVDFDGNIFPVIL
jgi:signal transduction histidine kinase